ncbi:Mediator of RNA polymerase II transcription subunit 7 [Cadophora gregata]|uniref:Mediator of RNA polymerase II transcription subunit 7 n=1 Tax=Cadophora gregata TaxID=51156 RepID=UPI0026DD9BFC|nr:Mediator of RNA polymerase II transcription subunit 7 [Cadophora gregata]KAK0120318.1 Mediator of RNA polymerase II transcription subunit 7 [Cadophora gregata]KAK0121350.1 Mediator of RNA polymerase II transcription subunit 7 [Cadophora gregata f. sp. sojae]
MEEQQQQPASSLATAFPSPPPFWKSFTPENTAQIATLRSAELSYPRQAQDPAKQVPVRILDLPAELRDLQPPEPPADGVYRCFGDLFRLDEPLPTLQALGLEQLYTPPGTPNGNGKHADRAFILKRMAKSLLLNFLELVGIMSIDPEQYAEKVDHIKTLFVNFHHLLNEYRPHQARESLILMMQDQLDRSRAETKGIREMKVKVETILEGLGAGLELDKGVLEGVVGKKEERKVVEEGKDVWDELERKFGVA